MIAVIADDLTGAAEIGGLGLRYDLNIEIVCSNDLKSDADLLIISTDTRSMPEKEALVATELLTAKLSEIKPGHSPPTSPPQKRPACTGQSGPGSDHKKWPVLY